MITSPVGLKRYMLQWDVYWMLMIPWHLCGKNHNNLQSCRWCQSYKGFTAVLVMSVIQALQLWRWCQTYQDLTCCAPQYTTVCTCTGKICHSIYARVYDVCYKIIYTCVSDVRHTTILLTTLLSRWDFSQGKFGSFPTEKPAATESRHPTYDTWWVF